MKIKYFSAAFMLTLLCMIISCSGTKSYNANENTQLEVKEEFIQIKRNMWDRQYNIVLATNAKDIYRNYKSVYDFNCLVITPESMNAISDYILNHCLPEDTASLRKHLHTVFEMTIIGKSGKHQCYINEKDGKAYFEGLLNAIPDSLQIERLRLSSTMWRYNFPLK